MKARVIANINKRLWPSLANKPLANPLRPNDLIDVIDEVEGEAPPNSTNTKWYKIKQGYYVWSGGVNVIADAGQTSYDWWHTQYHIREVWSKLGTRGEGVKIAVTDTGVSLNHPALFSKRTSAGKDYTNTSFRTDNFAHGTPVAGIIFAEAQSPGIAPGASLYVVKVVDTGTFQPQVLLQALRELPSDIDIVVLSHAFPRNEFDPSLDADFVTVASGKLIICGAGNDSNHHNPQPTDYYPAALQNFIAVGSCDNTNTIASNSVKSTRITLCAPGVDMKVLNPYDLAKPVIDSGTSYAAPFVAGVAALMKSYCRRKSKKLTNAQLITYLQATADKNASHNPQLYGAGIINPINAIKKIIP